MTVKNQHELIHSAVNTCVT